MDSISISPNTRIPLEEIELSAIRSQGAGGQHVNKTSTGIHLRFDIGNSSLPEEIKQRLLQRADRRITADGVVIIKSQQGRSQARNRIAALDSLAELVRSVLRVPKKRKATKPTKSSVTRRIEQKKGRGETKRLRQKVDF
ncbi:MAG: aminoacyl-tRNA hydrolase [Desulfuromonas sp.]|nr:MAG: aminoacyl-tRNA hydrolase [Desulfuromonas sp.]